MKQTSYARRAAALVIAGFCGMGTPGRGNSVVPAFEARTVDDKIGIGYGLAIGDVDGDGKPDILLADAREIVWYRNPDWKKTVITGSLTRRDHVCLAARDVNGDGRVEIAVGAQWNPGETVNEAESGAVFYLVPPPPGSPEGTRWTPVQLPHEPTVHRMAWVKNGEGHPCLVVVPLHGRGNKNGTGENGVRIHAFPFPRNPGEAASWKPALVADSLHTTHNLDILSEEDGGGERLVIGGREGFLEGLPKGAGWDLSPAEPGGQDAGAPPFAGIGEIRYGPAAGPDWMAAIEPFHGPNLAVYEKDAATRMWQRRVLATDMNQGHALACANLLGLPRDQIVAGWREPDASGSFGIRIHWQEKPEDPWKKAWVAEGNTMACEDLKVADLDADGRPDIIASGRATKNVVIYWNRTPKAGGR